MQTYCVLHEVISVWRLWDRVSLEQRCKQPTRCNKFRLLIFLLIYLNLLHMFRLTNSPIFRSTFDCIYSFGTMHRYCCRPVTTLSPVGSNIVALYQSQKCSWRWAKLSPETCRADSNRSIKRSINENCCILLVAYIVVTHNTVLLTVFYSFVLQLYTRGW